MGRRCKEDTHYALVHVYQESPLRGEHESSWPKEVHEAFREIASSEFGDI